MSLHNLSLCSFDFHCLTFLCCLHWQFAPWISNVWHFIQFTSAICPLDFRCLTFLYCLQWQFAPWISNVYIYVVYIDNLPLGFQMFDIFIQFTLAICPLDIKCLTLFILFTLTICPLDFSCLTFLYCLHWQFAPWIPIVWHLYTVYIDNTVAIWLK